MNKFKRWLLPVAIVFLLLATLIGGSCAPQSLGEIFDPSGNPFAHRFSDVTDIRTATFVVAASDSVHKYEADYFCDGTNDHVQIQQAIDALPATGGEVVLLDGTYNIEVSLVLDSYQTLRGCGRSTILTTTTADVDIITAAGGAGTEKVEILIADLCVDGNAGGAVNDIGIYWTFVDYSEIRGVYLQNNGEYGLRFFNCDFNNVHDSTFQSNAGDNISVTIGFHNSYMNNIILGGTAAGISIGTDDFSEIANNIVGENDGRGIKVTTSENVRISNNLCYKNGWDGIYTSALNHGTLSNNICIANSQDTDNALDNIRLEQSDYNLIEGNLCRQGAEANKPKYGINIRQAPNDKNVVVGNDLYDAGKTANFDDTGTRTIVTDDNRGISPVQVKHLIYVQNTSGGNLLTGNVVKYNAAAGSVGFTTPTAVGEDGVWGMLVEDIDNNAYGYIQVLGGTTLLDATNVVGGNIVIGDFLCTENGVRAQKAAAGDMAFAIALEDCAVADAVIDALIITPRKL